MRDRVVSFSSLLLVIASVVFFLAGAWQIMSGRMDVGGGIMMLSGWLLAGIVFAYRYADPKFLDPISIVKSR